MLHGWEGNRRSDVAPAMHHMTERAQWPRKEVESPLHWSTMASLPLPSNDVNEIGSSM